MELAQVATFVVYKASTEYVHKIG